MTILPAPARKLMIGSIAGLVALNNAGCEDATAKQRDEVHAKIEQVRHDLRKAMSGGAATPEAYQESLNKIVAQLASLQGAEPGQQAAGSLMAVDALCELASTHSAAAAEIESKHRSQLRTVNARLDAILRLQSLASGLDTIDAGARRAELQSQLDQANAAAQSLRARLQEVDGPINELTSQNQVQNEEVQRLRLQVGELLKTWQEKGYSAGFETYRQAADLGRQADRIELQISQREIELTHTLSPEQRMTQAQLAQVEAMIQAIDAAQGELDAFTKAASGDAQATRTKAAQLGKQIVDDLGSIESGAEGPLKAAYDGALAALEKAATSAQAAGRGGDANAGRMVSASVQEAIARLHLAAAHGLADRAATLEAVRAAGDAVRLDGLSTQLTQVNADRQKHVDGAKTAIESASQSLESGGAGAEGLRSSMKSLSDALAGKPAAPVAPEPAMPEPVATEPPANEVPVTPETPESSPAEAGEGNPPE